jgi:hypothetical protein
MNFPRNFMLEVGTVVLTFAAGSTFALDIDLPAETTSYRASTLPGYQMALRNCLTCHSAHYVQTQPATSPRTYWEATVHKMKTPFGAYIDDDDMPAIVDYLTKTYGAEQIAAPITPAAVAETQPEDEHKLRKMVKRIVIRKTVVAPLMAH